MGRPPGKKGRTSSGDTTLEPSKARAADRTRGVQSASTLNQPRGRRPAEQVSPARRNVGEFIRTMREAQRLSQDQVAALTTGRSWQLSRGAISSIERGRALPSLEALLALSRALHVDPMEVLERAELTSAVPVDLTHLSLDDLARDAHGKFWSGRFREALGSYDAMLERLALDPPVAEGARLEQLAEVELWRATTLRRCGALLAARATAERVVAFRTVAPRIRAEAFTQLRLLHLKMGNIALAVTFGREAVRTAEGCDSTIRGHALQQSGNVLLEAGEFDRAREAYLEARALLGGGVASLSSSSLEGNIALCWHGLGKVQVARDGVIRALELARKFGQAALEARWLVELGWIEWGANRLDQADRHGVAALAIAAQIEDRLLSFRAEWLRHRVTESRGNSADRHRLAFLRRSYVQLNEQGNEREVREFGEWLRSNTGGDREGQR